LPRSHSKARVYEPLDFAVLRAAALPVEAYLEIGADPRALLTDVRRRPPPGEEATLAERWLASLAEAVAVASESLWSAVEREDASPEEDDAVAAAILRYLIRMSTRPTPFGLFAGVALVGWGDTTHLSLSSRPPGRRRRVDMEWLASALRGLETDPGLRRELPWVARSAIVARGDRLFLTTLLDAEQAGGEPVSVRKTPLVVALLAAAASPTAYDRLVAAARTAEPDLPAEEVEQVLDRLREIGFLSIQVLPPLTGSEPAETAERLLSRPARHDRAARALRETLVADAATHEREPVQHSTDMRWELDAAVLGHAVGREAARAAELLLTITPAPAGSWRLASHRQRFRSRYGEDRRVPILEMLDPDVGIGWPDDRAAYAGGPEVERRARTLVEIGTAALHDRASSIELSDEILGRLSLGSDPAAGPASLELNAVIEAASAAAVDRGEFTLSLGPSVGSLAAGRSLGRFASLLGTDAVRAVESAARAEEATDAEALWAEVIYWPGRDRLANVMIRPAVRSAEVGDAATAGAAGISRIPVAELEVGLADDRFVVEWPRVARRVIPTTGHMLSYRAAPPLIRCLADVALEGSPLLAGFSWGPAVGLPALPRVTHGRLVLSPAQWRLDGATPLARAAKGGAEDFARELEGWRERWRVARHVQIGDGDNRLALDLDVPAHSELLQSQLRRRRQDVAMAVHELLPLPDGIWLEGPGGRFAAEITVPLVRRLGGERVPPPPARSRPTSEQRVVTPGGPWLYIKAYGPRALQDDMLIAVRALAEEARADRLVRTWFFIRYSDPSPHLRLRFAGEPETLIRELLPRLSRLLDRAVRNGSCASFSVETYEREVERFGGPAGIDIAETIFGIDTRTTIELLALAQGPGLPLDETALAVLSIDEFLRAVGLDEEARLLLLGRRPQGGVHTGAAFREQRQRLRGLLADPGMLAGEPGGTELLEILRQRGGELASSAQDLENALTRLEGVNPLDRVRRALVHLHVNRLVGPTHQRERELIDLLRRARLSLREHPDAAGPW
jgi:thiopeptide-type bacteriocin biosynthesis protein